MDLACEPRQWHIAYMVAASFVILISGLAAFSIRLGPGLRDFLRSGSARKRMSRGLRILVRRENVRQAIAALRVRQEIAIQPVETGMAARDSLKGRIEKIRLRSVTERNRRSACFGMAGSKGGVSISGSSFRVTPCLRGGSHAELAPTQQGC